MSFEFPLSRYYTDENMGCSKNKKENL